jgi:hypothetical protein
VANAGAAAHAGDGKNGVSSIHWGATWVRWSGTSHEQTPATSNHYSLGMPAARE